MSAIVGGVFLLVFVLGLWDIIYQGYQDVRDHWRKS